MLAFFSLHIVSIVFVIYHEFSYPCCVKSRALASIGRAKPNARPSRSITANRHLHPGGCAVRCQRHSPDWLSVRIAVYITLTIIAMACGSLARQVARLLVVIEAISLTLQAQIC